MRLQTKASLAVTGIFAGLIAVVSIVGRSVLSRDYQDLEERDARDAVGQMQRLFEAEVDDLVRSARDYAEWDDTVQLVKGEATTYADENWIAETLANLHVDMVVAFRAADEPAQGARLADGAIAPLDEEWVTALRPWVTRVTRAGASHLRVRGLARVGSQLALIAAVPILPTGGEGNPEGCLVHLRRLDDQVVSRLSGIVGHPVRVDVVSRREAPRHEGLDLAFLRPTEDTLKVTWGLSDADHRPIATATMTLRRDIATAGSRALNILLLEIAIAAALFGILVVTLIRLMVTGRLERLSAALRNLALRRDAAARIAIEGNDEIALVARETNALLDAVALHQSEKERAHEEREALQQQLMQAQKMEAVGEFAGGIAHDFNNCLTSIISWVQLVRNDLPPDHSGREGLADALNSARHAALVVRQLLLYSRPASLARVPVALNALVSESMGLMRSALPRSIELRVHASSVDDVVLADRTQLVQIMMNLLVNARDAMDGQGTLTIETHEVTLPDAQCSGTEALPPGRYAQLSVRDTGPGITPQNLQRIFQPFFTTKPQGKGTGLGLAVVQSVAARHHGCVTVSSEEGHGATFHVYLPRHEEAPAAPEVACELPDGCRVLMAEDDLAIQRVLSRVLEKHHCRISQAENGLEAWEMIQAAETPFDVVLTDLNMPGLSGMQLMERISNSGRALPVVLMTAYAATLDPKRVRDAGFAAVLAKPMVLEDVVRTLARVVRDASARGKR